MTGITSDILPPVLLLTPSKDTMNYDHVKVGGTEHTTQVEEIVTTNPL
ncbi:MAG: hypothetical protein LBF62_08390 [Tannerellaceae bacterium]|nr:hypothetical protein [Tannerellaceae bacterium]